MFSCNIVENAGPYVMVTDSSNDSTCTTGFYSSAKVDDLKKVTDFLRTNKDLEPFELTVVGEEK